MLRLDRLLGDFAQGDDRILVAVAIDREVGTARIWRARCAADSTRSNRLGILSTQSSTVTRAMVAPLFDYPFGRAGAIGGMPPKSTKRAMLAPLAPPLHRQWHGTAQPASGLQPHASPSTDNRLTLLTDGPERLEALLELIDGAGKASACFITSLRPTHSGRLVRDALIRAIDRGVDVALLVDGFGSSEAPHDYFLELREAGARFCRFLPSLGRRYLIRNHQKLALADDERVLIGGFNVEDDYFKTSRRGRLARPRPDGRRPGRGAAGALF